MKNCYLMVGVAGSGKSTVSQKIAEAIPGAVLFSLDDERLRFAQTADYREAFDYCTVNSNEFTQFVSAQWAKALKAQTVIVDNTNLAAKSRSRWIQEAKAKNFNIIGVQVNAPLQVVLGRQLTRGDKCVPANVIHNMYMRQQELMHDTEVSRIINIDGTKPLSPDFLEQGGK